MNEELVYLIAFKSLRNVGDGTIERLHRRFDSFKSAWHAPDDRIREMNLRNDILASIIKNRELINLSSIKTEVEHVTSQGIRICSKYNNDLYPEKLHELKDAPSLIYVKGRIERRDENAIAIVGTREVSQIGKEITRANAQNLAEAGYTVISGLARGTDTQAHLGALDVGGRTAAILGTGFGKNVLYPKENFSLFQKVAENGFCISEFAPDARGYGYKMYIRNRIISILSKGVLIIETSDKTHGGTIAQAWYAKNQGRKVFVVKAIDEVSQNNKGWQVLKRDVHPIVVESYEDILGEIDEPSPRQTNLLHYGVSTGEY